MAVKKWKLEYEVDMCANLHEIIIVQANTERKARMFAEKELYKKHFFLSFRSCKLIKEDNKNGKI